MPNLEMITNSPIPVIGLVLTICFILASLFLSLKSREDKLYIKKYTHRLKSKPPEKWVQIWQDETNQTERKIEDGHLAYADLTREVDRLERLKQRIKVGLLPPTFKQTDCESLKFAINQCRDEQFRIIRGGDATVGWSNWEWFGSVADGRRMVNGYRKLLLKAFNAEFEVILRQMRVSTYQNAVEKLHKLSESLATLGATARVEITSNYLSLKLDELAIWHAELVRQDEQKRELKEQQEILRSQAKNLTQADEDIEFQFEATDAELRHAVESARNKSLQERALLDLRITKIEEEKANLLEKLTRAKSQAQVTRAGFIYVISNIGSFGPGVVKIGMTRRLQPLDRIKELSDASVPFRFDLHTLAFTLDAPSVEKSLHRAFDNQRVNKQNMRREYFQTTPQDVQEVMENMGIQSDWYFEADAKEYRESLLIENARNETRNELAGSFSIPTEI